MSLSNDSKDCPEEEESSEDKLFRECLLLTGESNIVTKLDLLYPNLSLFELNFDCNFCLWCLPVEFFFKVDGAIIIRCTSCYLARRKKITR